MKESPDPFELFSGWVVVQNELSNGLVHSLLEHRRIDKAVECFDVVVALEEILLGLKFNNHLVKVTFHDCRFARGNASSWRVQGVPPCCRTRASSPMRARTSS